VRELEDEAREELPMMLQAKAEKLKEFRSGSYSSESYGC
jgi:hypothetical protein